MPATGAMLAGVTVEAAEAPVEPKEASAGPSIDEVAGEPTEASMGPSVKEAAGEPTEASVGPSVEEATETSANPSAPSAQAVTEEVAAVTMRDGTTEDEVLYEAAA